MLVLINLIIFFSSKPGSEVMKEYTRRIEFLKHTIDTEKMVHTSSFQWGGGGGGGGGLDCLNLCWNFNWSIGYYL